MPSHDIFGSDNHQPCHLSGLPLTESHHSMFTQWDNSALPVWLNGVREHWMRSAPLVPAAPRTCDLISLSLTEPDLIGTRIGNNLLKRTDTSGCVRVQDPVSTRLLRIDDLTTDRLGRYLLVYAPTKASKRTLSPCPVTLPTHSLEDLFKKNKNNLREKKND